MGYVLFLLDVAVLDWNFLPCQLSYYALYNSENCHHPSRRRHRRNRILDCCYRCVCCCWTLALRRYAVAAASKSGNHCFSSHRRMSSSSWIFALAFFLWGELSISERGPIFSLNCQAVCWTCFFRTKAKTTIPSADCVSFTLLLVEISLVTVSGAHASLGSRCFSKIMDRR